MACCASILHSLATAALLMHHSMEHTAGSAALSLYHKENLHFPALAEISNNRRHPSRRFLQISPRRKLTTISSAAQRSAATNTTHLWGHALWYTRGSCINKIKIKRNLRDAHNNKDLTRRSQKAISQMFASAHLRKRSRQKLKCMPSKYDYHFVKCLLSAAVELLM